MAEGDETPRHFRKKPVVIEAMQYSGNNIDEIHAWANGPEFDPNDVEQAMRAVLVGVVFEVEIETLEGAMFAQPGDWIIKGVAGEFYPCKPDIFDATYEVV